MIYFDWQYYINRYKDLKTSGINNNLSALNHWVRHGLKENRICNKIFENLNLKDYKSKLIHSNPELKTNHDLFLYFYKQKFPINNDNNDNNILEKIKNTNLLNNNFNINIEFNEIKINESLNKFPNIIPSIINVTNPPKYINDDDIKIVICSCVYKRFELSKFCINEWLKLNVYKVIVAYSFDEDYTNLISLCENYPNKLILVKYQNLPLSNKWNHSVYTAKQFNPDAIMIMGSDDIFTESYLNKVKYYINRDIDYISNNNWAHVWYFSNKVTLLTDRYINRQTDDGIGSGRIINARILNKINWNLYKFDKPINKILDLTSYKKINNLIKSKIFDIDGYSIFLLKLANDNTAISIKTDLQNFINTYYRNFEHNHTIDNFYNLNYSYN